MTTGTSNNENFQLFCKKCNDYVLIKIVHAHINKHCRFSMLDSTFKYLS